MKLNRIVTAFVLTGLLSGAAMAAQAQTSIMISIGTPVAAVVASYIPPCPGPGYEWVAGYYNGPTWVPGQWMHRVDSRVVMKNHYGDRGVQLNNRDRDMRSGNFDRNANPNHGHNNNAGPHGNDHRGGRH